MTKRFSAKKATSTKEEFAQRIASNWDPLIKATTSRESDKFILRLPDGMREHLAEVAENQGRPMNAVVISALTEYLSGAKTPLESQLAEIKTALLALTEKVNKQDPAA
jgi:hypothetical protein